MSHLSHLFVFFICVNCLLFFPLHLGLPTETQLKTKSYKFRKGSTLIFVHWLQGPSLDLFPR